MNTIRRTSRSLAGFVALFAAPLCHADGTTPASRWYYEGGAGAVKVEDSNVTLNFTLPPSDIEFRAGPGVDLLFGLRLRPDLALEFESGLSQSEMTGKNNVSDMRATLRMVPMLVNLAWRPSPEAQFSPVLGVGAGVSLGWLDMRDAQIQGDLVSGNEVAGVLSGQLFAGLEYRVNDKVRIGGMYKLLVSSSPGWDLTLYDATKAYGEIRIDHPVQHTLLVTCTVDF